MTEATTSHTGLRGSRSTLRSSRALPADVNPHVHLAPGESAPAADAVARPTRACTAVLLARSGMQLSGAGPGMCLPPREQAPPCRAAWPSWPGATGPGGSRHDAGDQTHRSRPRRPGQLEAGDTRPATRGGVGSGSASARTVLSRVHTWGARSARETVGAATVAEAMRGSRSGRGSSAESRTRRRRPARSRSPSSTA